MRAVLATAALVLVPALAPGGEIYRSTDDQGNPLFTDEPPAQGGKPVELEPLTTVPADDPPSGFARPGDSQAKAAPAAYDGLEVVYPPAGQAVRHNGGMVPFRVALQPKGKALAQGHRVEIVLDGEVRGSGPNTQVSVSPIERGSHTARARIVNASGTPVVASTPIDFHLLRASVGN